MPGKAAYQACRSLAGASVEDARDAARNLLSIYDAAIIKTLLNGTPNPAEPASTEIDRSPLRLSVLLNQNAIDEAQMAFLLALGGDPNAPDPKSLPLLLVAASQGDEGVGLARQLLEAGAARDAADEGGHNAIAYATRSPNEAGAMIRELARAGVDVDARDHSEEGFTALLAAVFTGREGAVEALIDAGADLELKTLGPINDTAHQVAIFCREDAETDEARECCERIEAMLARAAEARAAGSRQG